MLELLPLLVPAIGFTAVLLIGTLVYWAVRSRRDEARVALSRRVGGPQLRSTIVRAGLEEQARGGFMAELSRLIEESGAQTTSTAVLAATAVLALSGVVLIWTLARSPLAVIGVLLGVLPVFLLRQRASYRARRLTSQLPSALDLINRTLRAGHAFSDSLRITASELPAPIGEEFARVSEESRLGRELRDSLHDLVKRYPSSFDLRLFASSVLLQRDTGGRLGEILENLSDTIRERILFEDKVRALTAEVRFSAAVLTLLPVVLGLVIFLIQPRYFDPMFHTTAGRGMLLVGALLLLSGSWIMRVFSTVEV